MGGFGQNLGNLPPILKEFEFLGDRPKQVFIVQNRLYTKTGLETKRSHEEVLWGHPHITSYSSRFNVLGESLFF